MTIMKKRYDVAISFAGEDRDTARDIASELKKLDLSVFFDEDENLLGEDLSTYLADVYSRNSESVLLLISSSYVQKAWTRYERRHAFATALNKTDGPYVLPIRLDESVVEELPETVAYLSIPPDTPETVAQAVANKLGDDDGSPTKNADSNKSNTSRFKLAILVSAIAISLSLFGWYWFPEYLEKKALLEKIGARINAGEIRNIEVEIDRLKQLNVSADKISEFENKLAQNIEINHLQDELDNYKVEGIEGELVQLNEQGSLNNETYENMISKLQRNQRLLELLVKLETEKYQGLQSEIQWLGNNGLPSERVQSLRVSLERNRKLAEIEARLSNEEHAGLLVDIQWMNENGLPNERVLNLEKTLQRNIFLKETERKLNLGYATDSIIQELTDLAGAGVPHERLQILNDKYTVNLQLKKQREAQFREAARAEANFLNKVKLELVNIPAGVFNLGSRDGVVEKSHRYDEGPQVKVNVKSFEMSRYEITWAQWEACEEAGKCRTLQRPEWLKEQDKVIAGLHPVVHVSWDEAQLFVSWVNDNTRGGFSLPSEAQWEYAARADSNELFYTGKCISSDQANFNDSRSEFYDCPGSGVSRKRTVAVNELEASNAWGLAHMAGNVWEWVQDCYQSTYTEERSNAEPVEPPVGTQNCRGGRVIRGGSWNNGGENLRSTERGASKRNDSRFDFIGFRLSRKISN